MYLRKLGDDPTVEYIKSKQGHYYIYVLIDYMSEPFYVGITQGPKGRLREHCEVFRPSGFYVRNDAPWNTLHEYWVDCRNVGSPLLVEMKILEIWSDRETAYEREGEIIKSYRARGVLLRNIKHNA